MPYGAYTGYPTGGSVIGAGLLSGVNPLGLAATGLGTIASMIGANKKKMPSYKELQDRFGPGALSKNTLMLYNMLAESPQFRNSLNINALAGSNLASNTSAGLAKRGLTTTGIGTIASSIGQSAAQFGESSLRGGLFGTAGGLAQQNLGQLLSAYLATLEMGQNQQGPFDLLGSSLLKGGSALLSQPRA